MTPYSRTSLSLRRRSGWEAADAGILLWRNAFPLFLLFFVLPCVLCSAGLRLIPGLRSWTFLILWWMKPLWDRPLLHVVSVRFFNPRSSPGETLKGLRPHLGAGLPGDLLWRRFSPNRSGRMPLRVLEGLKGRELKRRIPVLERGGLGFGAFITILCLCLETLLLAGELFFLYMMLDMFRPGLLSPLWRHAETIEMVVFVCFLLNYILVETLYVCMGFGLYINSRLETEGWDIELLFRTFRAENRGHGKGGVSGGTGVIGGGKETLRSSLGVLLIIGALLTFAPPVPAESWEFQGKAEIPPGTGPSSGTEAPLGELEELLSSPDFGGEREGWGIRLKHEFEEAQEPPDIEFGPWIERMKEIIARTLRALLVIGLIVSAAFIFYKYRKTAVPGGGKRKRKLAALSRGQDVRPGAEALLREALARYGEGRQREAWAACFSSALAAYERGKGLRFPGESTEYECLRMVRGEEAYGATDFAGHVKHWVDYAYGGKEPDRASFEAFTDFCHGLIGLSGEGRDHA